MVIGCLAFGPAQARLGETLGQLKERFGKPAAQPKRDVVVWTFETRGGPFSYAVTFNAKGESISETIRPLQMADFSTDTAQSFITLQLDPYKDSKTLHAVQPGERYNFGGKSFMCSDDQAVIIDEPNRILIVWTRRGSLSVAAVRPEAMQ